MYDERNGSRIQVIWFSSHLLAAILAIIKLWGGIPDWPWWIVLAPFIFDLVLFIAIIFAFCFLILYSM